MAENEKDKKDFEFIQEQVIEKKRKKIKKRLLPIVTTLFLAILFGLVAAFTFVISEPRLYDLLHKDEETKTPVSFPTPSPVIQEPLPTVTPVITEGEGDKDNPEDSETAEQEQPIPTPVIQKINANIEDYKGIYNDIRQVANDVEKSIVDVSCTFTVVDWFNKSVQKTEDTSGIIVADNTADYLILVSLDRVKDADSIQIKFSDTMYAAAEIQDYESELNLALLAVAKEDIPPLYLNSIQVAKLGESYAITIGNPILALGNPNGHLDSLELGMVTSKGSSASITDNRIDLFNTDITDNQDSDGVIINLDGEIIGLITRTLKEDINKELSTAIGISRLKPYIERMANQKPRMLCGIIAEDMTEPAKLEHEIKNGIYVNEVETDSPAFEAGMKSGDIIMFVNEQAIINTNYFYNCISSFQPGQEITIKVKRTSGTTEKDVDLTVTLAEKAQ